MSRRAPVALGLLLVLLAPGLARAAARTPGGAPLEAAATTADPTPEEVAPGEVVVVLRPGADGPSVARALTGDAGEAVPGRPDLRVLRTAPGNEEALARRASRSTAVAGAEPNAIMHATALPNDPLFRRQWNLGERASAAGSANWLPARELGADGTGVIVAVLDTGVTPNAELTRVLPGANFADGSTDTGDPNGHGTHVAGTVAQATDNLTGVAGVAPSASILPVRVLDADGDGRESRIMAGIAYAVRQGAKVINLSLGGGGPLICTAVRQATLAGVVVVAATGNEGGPVEYPAACPDAVAVGASTLTGAVAGYSNFGQQVTLVAPGGDTSADLNRDGSPDGILQYTVAGGRAGYYYFSGTSMASPHAAGAAALVFQMAPQLDADQVKAILVKTALDGGAVGFDPQYGAGLLDIGLAVATAKATVVGLPTSTTLPPTTTTTTTRVASPATTAPILQIPPTTAPPLPVLATSVTRLSGESRFATAVAASEAGWPDGAPRAYLATSKSFADALSAGALAGRRPGPLLLSEPCSLPEVTRAELARLRPATVRVIGGEVALCTGLTEQVKEITGATVVRIAGSDRFATSAALSQDGWGSSRTVYVAGGAGFADALSGGALAAKGDAPVLLTDSCRLPGSIQAELLRLRPSRVVLLGGEATICAAVADAIGQVTGIEAVRIAGSDRYATAAALAAEGWVTSENVYVASGLDFPDGLAAGPLASKGKGPLLLVPACDVPQSTSSALRKLHALHITVVGGTGVICQGLLSRLAASSA